MGGWAGGWVSKWVGGWVRFVCVCVRGCVCVSIYIREVSLHVFWCL